MNVRSVNRQRGMATLFMALVVLVLMTLISVYASRTTLFEQKMSGNDVRSRQAFEAAESGIQAAFAYLQDGWDRNGDGSIDPIYDTSNPLDGVGDSNSKTFANASSVTVTITGAHPNYTISAVGMSDDRSASRTVTTQTAVPDALPNTPDNPLTAKGAVVITGSATVHNLEGHSTIWSGEDVELGSNNATATNIADPADSNYPGCMDITLSDDPSNVCDSLQSSNKVNVGLDVVENDSNLKNMTSDQTFENFFGIGMAAYKERSVTLEVAPANIGELASADPPGARMATNEIVFVDGDTTFPNGNLTIGCRVQVTGNSLCTGNNIQPSILIINGNLTIQGTPNITGLIYVHGSVTVSGNVTIMGAMVVAGTTTSNTGGSMDVWFNSDALNDLSNLGKVTNTAGAWRDW